MSKIRWLVASVGAVLSGCSVATDSQTEHLAGAYYLCTDYEGYSSVQYGRGWLAPAVVVAGVPVDSVGVVGPYLAVCVGEEALRSYYLLPLAAPSGPHALATRLGPLPALAFRRWGGSSRAARGCGYGRRLAKRRCGSR